MQQCFLGKIVPLVNPFFRRSFKCPAWRIPLTKWQRPSMVAGIWPSIIVRKLGVTRHAENICVFRLRPINAKSCSMPATFNHQNDSEWLITINDPHCHCCHSVQALLNLYRLLVWMASAFPRRSAKQSRICASLFCSQLTASRKCGGEGKHGFLQRTFSNQLPRSNGILRGYS